MLIFLIGEAFAREQSNDILQSAQVTVGPVPTLFAAFVQVLPFLKTLRRSMGNPLFKFSATTFYFAEFYALICHSRLDAQPPRMCLLAPRRTVSFAFLRC
jgi:hypothetical protein